ncbi:hypothetical protein [Terasakiella sp. SH-1]|uniref:hypothetical protein n=1 Tax=Terasakiella sp. SH-1 TaxID=2560057 RepID=UPI001072FB10|nr:hypothetical protein [Terasakiella sp. SH-1]
MRSFVFSLTLLAASFGAFATHAGTVGVPEAPNLMPAPAPAPAPASVQSVDSSLSAAQCTSLKETYIGSKPVVQERLKTLYPTCLKDL